MINLATDSHRLNTDRMWQKKITVQDEVSEVSDEVQDKVSDTKIGTR